MARSRSRGRRRDRRRPAGAQDTLEANKRPKDSRPHISSRKWTIRICRTIFGGMFTLANTCILASAASETLSSAVNE
eukprot:800490-Amphidinium_carterae.1